MDIYERILRTEYKPNCYVLVSFEKDKRALEMGDVRANPIMSFLYDAGEIAAEWCPPHGPIQIWRKADKDTKYKQPTFDDDATPDYIEPQPHYAYPFVIPRLAEWSQLSVERYQLADYAIEGNYQYIFNVLKTWTENR